MSSVLPHPTRSTPAAVSQCLIAFSLGGLGMVAGVTWMYIVAAVFTVGIAVGVMLAIAGARNARVVAVDGPPIAIAGEDTQLNVTAASKRAVVFELSDGPHTVARWRQPAGRHRGQVIARFSSRGVVDELRVTVQCAGPFGTWWWVRRIQIPLREPIAVGPAPIAAAPTPASLSAGEGADSATRSGAEPGALLGLRPWADGDPISWVHWPSAARGGEVLVRQWQPPANIATEVHLDRCDDPAGAEHAAAVASGQIEAALQSGGNVRVSVPERGGTMITATVGDRWAGAKIVAEADLPRHLEPFDPPAVDQREISRAAQFAVSAVAFIACATTANSTDQSAFIWLVTLVVLPTLTLLRARTLQAPSGRSTTRGSIAIATIIGAVAVMRFARTVAAAGSTQVFTVGDALVEVLAVLVALRSAMGTERRVLRFCLGASSALMGFGAALRFDPWFAWSISLWAISVAVAFMALHRSETIAGCTTRLVTAPMTLSQRSRRSAGALGGAMLIVALAFVALIAVPIPEGPVRLLSPSKVPEFIRVPASGGLAARNADGEVVESTVDDPRPSAAFGYSAFTSSFDLSQRGRPGNEIVMRVRAPAPDFWRAQTFETFDGRSWTVSSDPGIPQRGPVITVPPRLGDARTAPTDELVQTFMLEQDMTNLVFAASRPTQVLLDANVWVRPDGALRANTVLTAGSEYTVVSERVLVTEELLRSQAGPRDATWGSAWTAPGSSPYLQLPATTTDRVRELTLAITDPYPDVYGKVQAIEAWLAANVEYDLNAPIPPDGWDAVDHFVFESKRGFCEQIATTLVIMLRSIGVPARVAAGYTPGERDPFAGVWVVREGDAHAWAEVWFPATGWQAFDPTAEVPFAGETAGLRSLGFPIIEATVQFIFRWAPLAFLVLTAAAALGAVVWWLRLAIRAKREPIWAAQRQFQRICRQSQIAVGAADTNESLALQLSARYPGCRVPAQAAVSALDAAAFGTADPADPLRLMSDLRQALSSQRRSGETPTPTAATSVR